MARRTAPEALPVRELRRLDLNAAELGIPVSRLMARAGKALASRVQAALGPRGGRALFLCGKGNNGGDGLAAAYLLHRAGRAVDVALAEEQVAEPARLYRDLLPQERVAVYAGKPPLAWSEATVVVDCLLGSGLSGPPRPPYAALIRWINGRRRHARVIACDVPSGLGSRPAVRPHETVTFHAPKQGMAPATCGAIHVAGIGIPKAAEDAGVGDLVLAYPVPRPGSHKGDNGVVLLVAGGPYTGAPFYAGMAAYRTGVDLVHAWMPDEAARIVAGYGPHLLVRAAEPGWRLTPLGTPPIVEAMDRATALLVGPGLGPDPATREAVGILLAEAARRDLPTVVDADGLDALSPALLQRHGRRMVLTPHSREFADLAGTAPTEATVRRFAAQNGGVTVVWKSQGAFVTDGESRRWCRRGHPTMTVGGTGDVLAGAIAALLAKGAPPFEAGCAGAYLTGSAGEVAAALRSWGALATDVAEAIPAVLQRMESA